MSKSIVSITTTLFLIVSIIFLLVSMLSVNSINVPLTDEETSSSLSERTYEQNYPPECRYVQDSFTGKIMDMYQVSDVFHSILDENSRNELFVLPDFLYYHREKSPDEYTGIRTMEHRSLHPFFYIEIKPHITGSMKNGGYIVPNINGIGENPYILRGLPSHLNRLGNIDITYLPEEMIIRQIFHQKEASPGFVSYIISKYAVLSSPNTLDENDNPLLPSHCSIPSVSEYVHENPHLFSRQ